MPPKLKSLIVIIVFLGIIILPLSYALYKEYIIKHPTEKAVTPTTTGQNK